MSVHDDLPVDADPDPVDSDDPAVLRHEILRLRECLLGANGRNEVLRDRIAELEEREEELDARIDGLLRQISRSPLARLRNAVHRRRQAS